LRGAGRESVSSGNNKKSVSSGNKESLRDAAEKLGISASGIAKADVILEHAPELETAVMTGARTLNSLKGQRIVTVSFAASAMRHFLVGAPAVTIAPRKRNRFSRRYRCGIPS
jgi:hypothetical protein